MSAAATATTTETHPKKAAQVHMINHLAALAMLLDDDHIETLLLTICRDNDIVPMLFRRDTFTGDEGEFDGAALFTALNSSLWEQGLKVLKDATATGPLETAASAGVSGGAAATIQHC